MKYFLRLVWAISATGFLYALFYFYGHISQIVDIELINGHFLLSRNEFFFFFFFIFAIANFLIIWLRQLIPAIPDKLFWIPRRQFWLTDYLHRKSANVILQNNLALLAATVNYFIIFWMMVVGSDNHFEGTRNPNLSFFQWPAIFMVFCVLMPWFRLWVKNPNLLSQRDRI